MSVDTPSTQTFVTVGTWSGVALAFITFLTLLVNKIFAKLDEIKKVTDTTHVLVNSGYRPHLVKIVIMAARLAKATGEQGDIDEWKRAEKELSDHDTKQAVADGVAAGLRLK